MSRILYRAKFGALRFRLLKRKGNPFNLPELHDHFYPGYQLAIFTTLPGHTQFKAGHWPIKLVTMKPESNLDWKDRHFGCTFALLYQHEVLLHLHYRQAADADEFMFVFFNLSNGLTRRQVMFIKHKAIPPVLIN